jgi:hypothetical protein
VRLGESETGLEITISYEKFLRAVYDCGVRHGIDVAKGKEDKLVADKSETLAKEVMSIKPELVGSAIFKADYKPYNLGYGNDKPDLELPEEVAVEWFGLPIGSKMEVKARANRMLYFVKLFPHEDAAIIALFNDVGGWMSPVIELVGLITREQAMALYNADPTGHTIDFKMGIGPQPVWRENELTKFHLTPFEVNRLFNLGFKVREI